jgi:hypothetical protein
MALAAAQVVDALAARLAPQVLGTGGVRTSRTWPWDEAELPAARVFAADEQVLESTIGDAINQHTLGVDVQYTLRAVADADDAMHALAEAGLALLFAPPLPHGLQLVGINRETTGDGEAANARITLQLQCTYFVAPAAPGVILS